MAAVAAIYARKSKFTEKGDSITNQIRLCIKYLEDMGITEYIVYKDEGFSGKNTERPEFLKMLKDAQLRKFNTLICYKVDRVSRSVADFSGLVAELERYNISFISVNEQFDTSTAMGKAMMFICSVFGQLERETISTRIRDNMYALAQNGNWLGGKEPTGYRNKRIKYLDENGKERSYCVLELVENDMDAVRFVFKKYLELKSLSKVEKYMLSNNIRTKSGSDWYKSTLKSILTNPVYVKADKTVIDYLKSQGASVYGEADGKRGILIYSKRNGKVGKYKEKSDWIYSIAEHDGVISPDDWLNVQKFLSENRSKAPALGSSSTALLSGLARCAKCGSYMRVSYGKQYGDKGIKKFYYVCSLKNNSGKTRCDNRNINGPELDAMIAEKIREISLDKNTLTSELEKHRENIRGSSDNIEYKNISQSLRQNNIMIQNLLNNVSLTTEKETVEMIFQRINELKEENRLLEKKFDEMNRALECSARIKPEDFIEMLENQNMSSDVLSIEEKRAIVASIIDKVHINGDTGEVNIQYKQIQALN